MKSKLLLITFTALLSLQNLNAQLSAKVGGGLTFKRPLKTVFDIGFEYRVIKRLSLQVSLTLTGKNYGGSDYLNKNMICPQIRYYFTDDHGISPYVGVLYQRYSSSEYLHDDYGPYKKTDYNGFGGGAIGGFLIWFNKHYGLDLHLGYVKLKGTQTSSNREYNKNIDLSTETKNLGINRGLWGLNLFYYEKF